MSTENQEKVDDRYIGGGEKKELNHPPSSIDGGTLNSYNAHLEAKHQVQLTVYQKIFYYMLFMIMGSGANWVYPTALAQEIPYFENHQPEELCIATYMNATTNIGLFFMITYVYIHQNITPIPYEYSVPALLLTSAFGCFFSSAVYGITAGDVSIMLYLCCAIGGAVGALSSVVMNPFMTQFDNFFISAARSGGSFFILLCALISFAQDPGADNQRFSVTAYLCIFGILLSLPIFAYYYITKNGIGRRHKQANDNMVTVELNDIRLSTNRLSTNGKNRASLENRHSADIGTNGTDKITSEHNPMFADKVSKEQSEPTQDIEKKERVTEESASASEDVEDAVGDYELEQIIEKSRNNILQPYLTAFTHFVISDAMHKKIPWLRETLPYMMTVGWVNFNTWGIVTAVMPFAMANISSGSGSVNLSIAYQLGAFLLVLGDFSTTFIQLRIFPALVTFSAFCFTIYVAAISGNGFQNSAAPAIVITIFAIERFLEAHVVTSAYRAIATRFPIVYRQSASRAVGMSDQISTTCGALLSTLVVSLAFSCSSSVDD